MGHVIGAITWHFEQPWWLLLAVLAIPAVWLGRRHMAALGSVRRWSAIVLRVLVIVILVLLLARLMVGRRNERVTLVAVLDRSQSIPEPMRGQGLDYLNTALANVQQSGAVGEGVGEQLAVVDIAEFASISALASSLPSEGAAIRERNTSLAGEQSRLSDGIEMAMAIAPPDSAVRIVLLSDGNETGGNLREAARTAAANQIPIDVVPVQYEYENEVIFRNLAAPVRVRSGETVGLRFVLTSTAASRGELQLTMNGRPVDLDPTSERIGAAVELEPGTNVRTISVPVGERGIHEFKAVFVPEDGGQDQIVQNNQASSLTFVAGPGQVLVLDVDGSAGPPLANVLQGSGLFARYQPAAELTDNLALLMDTDAVVLVNTDASQFTFQQQEMLVRYVTELGGGLIMVGGDQSFGAGGWIGSEVAQILPVDPDPPQKKQMPKGALALIMHACEMPQGNFWGKQTAVAAVRSLSRMDEAGILNFQWQAGSTDWVYPLQPVGDRSQVIAAINGMQMGDMPDFGPHMQSAYDALTASDAAQKHVIIISDGDPQMPTQQLLQQYRQAKITCSGVAVFPHSPSDVQSLATIAQATNGRFYNVSDPQKLPQIFIKEAQTVRRALLLEQTFTPRVEFALNEILRGFAGWPQLDGYVLTGPRAGLSQILLSSDEGDPILAVRQAGLGRTVAFTSSVDSRWASAWRGWSGNPRFWEQVVRWAAKPAQSTDAEVFADVEGRDVHLQIEATDEDGRFIQLSDVQAQIIRPDMNAETVPLTQVGPGQFRADYQAGTSGSYLLNLRYKRRSDDEQVQLMQAPITVPFAPEFRDLKDNTGLLEQVAQMTGGRVLAADPMEAEPFSMEGLKFPVTPLPVTKWLLIAWVALFLLDVAVRRVAVDFAAMARRAVRLVTVRRGAQKTDETLDRLRLRREQVRERFRTHEQAGVAKRRYEARPGDGDQAESPLPTADVAPPPERGRPKPAAKPKDKPPAAPGDQPEHIQQLLRAKKKASGGEGKKE